MLSDKYLQRIPSHAKTAISFHAKDDAPEVRYLVYKLLSQLDFKTQFIVARKKEEIFRNRYRAKENKFYDDLVTRLFENVLHRFAHNRICFSIRGSRARWKPLEHAIWRAKGQFDKRHNTGVDNTSCSLEPQTPKGEPCLSIIDYMNWAVYRAYTKSEMRFYQSVEEKVSFLRDVYDFEARPNTYCWKRPFAIEHAAPLRLGSHPSARHEKPTFTTEEQRSLEIVAPAE